MRIRAFALPVAAIAALLVLTACAADEWGEWQRVSDETHQTISETPRPTTPEEGLDAAANAVGTIGPSVAPLLGPAAPWVAGGSAIVSAILGAIATHRRERQKTEAVVRSVEKAKVGTLDGSNGRKIVVDLDTLGTVQDAAGVREIVRRARR